MAFVRYCRYFKYMIQFKLIEIFQTEMECEFKQKSTLCLINYKYPLIL